MMRGTRRIVFVLQASPAGSSSFEPVLRLARHGETRIEGVFVEDSRMFEVAAYPAARLVHTRSRETTAMDEGAVRRALRATSVRVQKELAACFTESSIPWSFTSRRCAVLSDAFGEASPGDLVVVPLLRDGSNADQVADLITTVTQRVAISLLVLNGRGVPTSSILMLFDGDLDDLGAALDLAVNFDCSARVLAVADNRKDSDALTEQARTFLKAANHKAPVDSLVYGDVGELEKTVRDATPGTLVIDRDGRIARTLDLAKLLASSEISLYLRN